MVGFVSLRYGQNNHRSLVVFAQDIAPDTVIEVCNETCLLRRYLDAGGRVVCWGDLPFWYQGKAGQAQEKWYANGPRAILGVQYENYEFRWASPNQGQKGGRIWDAPLTIAITPMGREIGLTRPNRNIRIQPIPCQDILTPYAVVADAILLEGLSAEAVGQELAVCWKRNYNERYPHSGFMQYFTGNFSWREDALEGFFKFAISGWPLLFE